MKTRYLRDMVADYKNGVATATPPSAIYLSLLDGDPSIEGDASTEIAGLTRQLVTLSAAENGVATITNPITFTSPPSGRAVYWATFDAVTGGNMLEYFALPTEWVIGGANIELEVGRLKLLEK